LRTAQREIATDWVTAYKKYVGGSLASALYSKPASVAGSEPASPWPFNTAASC